jgi:hypothetical protein
MEGTVADPRIDAYIDALPEWQQSICRTVRALVHAADPGVTETIKRTDRPYFVLQGNICALLAARDHVNVFLYDPIVPDPELIITSGHDNKTVSRKLEQIKSGGAPVRYLPNGVDLAVAKRARACTIPPDLACLPRPIVGYLGSYDSRLDWPLVTGIARARPTWSFAFVGGGYTLPVDPPPNLHLMGNHLSYHGSRPGASVRADQVPGRTLRCVDPRSVLALC